MFRYLKEQLITHCVMLQACLAESELNPKPVSVVDLVSIQTVELKPDAGSRMAAPHRYCDIIYPGFFLTFRLPMTCY